MNESFPYRAKTTPMLLAGLFFGVCAAWFLHLWSTNDRGLVLNGIIELGAVGAGRFYAGLAVTSTLFVIAAIAALLHGAAKKTVLVLAPDHLLIPRGFWRPTVQRVAFTDITGAALQEVAGQKTLLLTTNNGRAAITRSMLSPESAFDRIIEVVEQHLANRHR
ncbi:MAG: hypothetical protein Q8M02_05195 [Candidatus Didemnitutus sp.]|nr:hypothetical protein [Candidatus Didemnitutus sp.]